MKNNFLLSMDGEEMSAECVQALEKALDGFVKSDVKLAFEIVFVDEKEIQDLNRETRGLDKVTDVLSYPTLDGIKGKALSKKDYPYDLDEDGNLCVGSIAVCVKRAKELAEEYGHSYARELHYLIVHGVLHCLGYDHMVDEDKAEMRANEEKILQKLGITRE